MLVNNISLIVFESQYDGERLLAFFTVLSVGVSIALLIPEFSVTARRLHDTGLSGWWIFLPLTIIGWIPFLV